MKISLSKPFIRISIPFSALLAAGFVALSFSLASAAAPVISDGTSDAAPSTLILDKEEASLKALSAALTKVSGAECGAIEKTSSGYSLETVRCLPAPIRRLIGKYSVVEGPNCFALANMTSGLQSVVRYVTKTEIDFYTYPHAGYCTKVKGPAQPGDLAMVVAHTPEASENFHGYIHLTDKFAITKNGSEVGFPWKIGRVKEINEKYAVSSLPKKPKSSQWVDVTYYKCADKGPAKDPVLQKFTAPLSSFGKAMESALLKTPISVATVKDMDRTLLELNKALTPAVIKAFRQPKDQFEATRLLLEVYSHIATFSYIMADKAGTFENTVAKTEYLRVRDNFQKFIHKAAGQTGTVDLVDDELIKGPAEQ